MPTNGLAHILPNIPGDTPNANFCGMALPSTENDPNFPAGVDWVRMPWGRCAACTRFNDTCGAYKRIAFSPVEKTKPLLNFYIGKGNLCRENRRREFSLTNQWHREQHGIFESEMLAPDGVSTIYDKYEGWELRNVNGEYLVTLKRLADTADPLKLFASVPGKWVKLPPRGCMRLSGNALQSRREWIVRRVVADGRTSVAVGEEFQLELTTPISADALELWPEATGPITVTWVGYVNFPEPYPDIQDYEGLFVKPAIVLITNGGLDLEESEYTIFGGKIAWPEPPYFTTWKWTGTGAPTEDDLEDAAHWLLIDLTAKVHVHQSGGAFITRLDLQGYPVTGIKGIRVDCYTQVEGDDKAACFHGAWCLQNKIDHTGTMNGALDELGRVHYCAAQASLRGIGEPGAMALENYTARCYQIGDCPLAAKMKPQPEVDERTDAQFLYGTPFRSTMAAGNPDEMIERKDIPGVIALVGGGSGAVAASPVLSVAGNFYGDKFVNHYHCGGYEQMIDAGNGVLRFIAGGHWLDTALAGYTPNATNSGTWPPLGPMSSSWTERKTERDQLADDTTDPAWNELARPMPGGVDITMQTQQRSGHLAKYVRWRPGWKFWIPRLAANIGRFDYPDGCVVEFGYWDAHFVACEAPAAVYYMKISWTKGAQYNRTKAALLSGQVRPATVSTVEAGPGTGQFYLNLKNAEVTLKSIGSGSGDFITRVAMGGLHVAPREAWRLRNYACLASYWGPGVNCARAGMGVIFTDSSLAGTWLAGKTFLIDLAEPHAGPGQSWIPDGMTYEGDSAAYYTNEIAGKHAASLYQGFDSIGNKQDRLTVKEEGALIADFLTANGANALNGKEISVVIDPLGMPGTGALAFLDPENAANDVEIGAGDVVVLAASGELYSKVIPEAGRCPVVSVTAPDLCCRPTAQGQNGKRVTLEAVSWGMGL
jgi:hypothetical protein